MDATNRTSPRASVESTAAARVDNGATQELILFPFGITVAGPNGKGFKLPVPNHLIPSMLCSSLCQYAQWHFCDKVYSGNPERDLSIKFNGKTYFPDMSLAEIYKEEDFDKPFCVTAEFTEAAMAAMKLMEKIGKEGSFKITDLKNISYESKGFSSHQEAENFLKNIPNIIPGIKIKLYETMIVKPHLVLPDSCPIHVASFQINGAQAGAIINAVTAAREIGSVAPFIAQAMRHPQENSLGMLPLDVLCNLGPFLAPDLPEEYAFEVFERNIHESQEKFWAREEFRRIEPIKLAGVRTSIGATSCLLLDKGGISRAQAERLEKTASVNFSTQGIELKFPDKEYAERFFHGLKNSGYSSIASFEHVTSDKFGSYEAVVQIKDLHEVKKFVEVTCGYSSSYTKDLFATSKGMALDAKFFIDELTYIANLKNSSTAQKKQMAKAVLDGFLDRLRPNEAAGLRLKISELARPNDKGEPGPLQFLREHTGIRSVLPGVSYSDEAGAYKAVLARIGKLIPKSS